MLTFKPYDMKKSFFAALAAVVVGASVQAQSTADSIASKYKLQPMPASMTLEETFPVIGSYQLTNSTDAATTLTVNLDSSNKGIVWVDGLPQGKVKAYLKKSPATYRILPQKSGSGKAIQEGTLYYDTTAHTLHIAIGKAYNETDPTGLFDATSDMNGMDMNAAASNNGTDETKVKAGDTKVKTEMKGNKMKTKSKMGTDKTKSKVWFYTATKTGMDNMNGGMMNNNQTQQSDSTQHQ